MLGEDVQLRLDTLSRRDSQQTLSHTGREARHRRARARHLAVRVGEQALVLVEGDEPYCLSSAQHVLSNTLPSVDGLPLDKSAQGHSRENVRIPALAEFPIMSVVHPAYHCGPNGGHGSFLPSASRRFSCVLVLATVPSSGRTVSSAFLSHHMSRCVSHVHNSSCPSA